MELRPRLRRLRLTEFRSYLDLDAAFESHLVALVGENGAGKTNLLEAISLLAPGRGLRRAALSEFPRLGGVGPWAVAALIETPSDGFMQRDRIGTGQSRRAEAPARQFRLNGETQATARAFPAIANVAWLTPAMDGLFSGPASDRRRFLDRLAASLDVEHTARVSALDKALRDRNRLLSEGRLGGRWIDAVEREVAAVAIAVAAGRTETVDRLQMSIQNAAERNTGFPEAEIALSGVVETMLRQDTALTVEERYRGLLEQERGRDQAAGRTLAGPHLSDLIVAHAQKHIAADLCSTGEQKALLIGIILAHARLIAQTTGRAPILLLDEVMAHLDPRRRVLLIETLTALGTQAFITAADPAAIASMPPLAQIFSVERSALTLRK